MGGGTLNERRVCSRGALAVTTTTPSPFHPGWRIMCHVCVRPGRIAPRSSLPFLTPARLLHRRKRQLLSVISTCASAASTTPEPPYAALAHSRLLKLAPLLTLAFVSFCCPPLPPPSRPPPLSTSPPPAARPLDTHKLSMLYRSAHAPRLHTHTLIRSPGSHRLALLPLTRRRPRRGSRRVHLRLLHGHTRTRHGVANIRKVSLLKCGRNSCWCWPPPSYSLALKHNANRTPAPPPPAPRARV